MFDLASIIGSGDVFPPQKILIYGVQGLGKTTFGATFEKPILLRTEDGAAALNIPTFPGLVTEYQHMLDAITALHGVHPFKSLVLDSLDWMEPIVHAHTCLFLKNKNDEPVKSIEEPGYGKGYIEADTHWRMLMGGLDSLRYNMGMTIVIVSHAEIKRFEPPDSAGYDRYQIKLQKRAWALWQEWADMVLFCNFRKALIPTDKKGEKVRAEGVGERIIYTEERPALIAKNRWGLPPEINIGNDRTWAGFHRALNVATNGRYLIPEKIKES